MQALPTKFEVIIFYKYTNVADPNGFMSWIRDLCTREDIKGRILIAHEGINGTVEGTRQQLYIFESAMRTNTFGDFSDLWFKSSPGTGSAFKKLRIKVRDVILNIGLEDADIDPNKITGTHISAEQLHDWFANNEDFTIVDMRNDYEFQVGRFDRSIDPGMRNFRDLKTVLPKLDGLKKKKVLTVCTYGVRCEKASGYLLENGFQDVYQLHGGIGSYMKKFPGQNFKGSLYVFDERITEQFTDDYEVVGVCYSCESKSEVFGNCANSICHRQLIICNDCSTSKVFCEDCSQNSSIKP